jgi:hypothetical protein
MGREDQIEEREVLDSIFPDEITGKLFCQRRGPFWLFLLIVKFDMQTYPKLHTEYPLHSTPLNMAKRKQNNL